MSDETIVLAGPEERREAVLEHAAAYLIALDSERSDVVRKVLCQDSDADPLLSGDPERVCRLCERYIRAIAIGHEVSVPPADELRGIASEGRAVANVAPANELLGLGRGKR